MGISRIDVECNSLIDSEVLEYIPETCPVCGSDIEFTDSLKQIYCVNDRCALKIASRLESMAKDMKADGWGESACLTAVQQFNLKSPYQIFIIKDKGLDCPDIPAFQKKLDSICDMNKRTVRLWEVVKLGNLPHIAQIAYKLFDGFDTLSEAYDALETYEVPFIAERLGLRDSESSIMAVRIYNTLIQYKQELLFGETQFKVYKPEGKKISIAITGGVEGFKNKSEFIQYINNRYYGQISATLVNTVSSNVDILVADNDTSSRKYKQACKLRENGNDILITTSSGLLEYLDAGADNNV